MRFTFDVEKQIYQLGKVTNESSYINEDIKTALAPRERGITGEVLPESGEKIVWNKCIHCIHATDSTYPDLCKPYSCPALSKDCRVSYVSV